MTLGGTGKEVGDRHPKIHDNVLIGASATILGNIVVGKGAQVAAGSLVLKPVPPHAMVAGSPAKEIGKVSGCPALKMEQWCKKLDADSNLFGKVDPLDVSTCMSRVLFQVSEETFLDTVQVIHPLTHSRPPLRMA